MFKLFAFSFLTKEETDNESYFVLTGKAFGLFFLSFLYKTQEILG